MDYSPLVKQVDGFGNIVLDPADKLITGNLEVQSTLNSPSGTAFPASPATGDIFWRTDKQQLYRYDGSGWIFTRPGEIGSSAPASPYDGQQWYDNSSGERILFIYDGSRSKWLSSSEWTLQWGHDNATAELLRGPGIRTPGVGTGILIPKNCTIVRITAQQRTGITTKRIDILVNGTSTLNFNVSANVYKNNSVNTNVAEDDYIWVEIGSAGVNSRDITVTLWFAWRG